MTQIERIFDIDFSAFAILKQESLQEGFIFLHKFEKEWNSGRIRFDREGEGLFLVKKNNKIIGIGGVTISPAAPPTTGIGRIRSLYIKQEARGLGAGTLLLNHIIDFSEQNFAYLQLQTKKRMATNFYKKFGFEKLKGTFEVSHQMEIV